jgi:ABC-2 type transport system permease protein
MRKLWLVAKYEYCRYVFRKSFIATLLSVPLTIMLIFGLVWVINATRNKDAPVGYVDHSGFLADPVPPPRRAGSPNDAGVADLLPMIVFHTEEKARNALESGEIQAYYVIAPDYLESNKVELVYLKPPGHNVTRQFWDFMQVNRIRDVPKDMARRAVADYNLIVHWPKGGLGGGREFSKKTFLSNLLPLFTGIAFVMLLFMSSGYLMGAVTEEKENRTMEIMVTSISPIQLMGGKVLGTVALSFTLLLVWTAFACLGVLFAGYGLGIKAFQTVTVNPYIILTMLAIAVPTYVMIAAMMTAFGTMVTEAQEAQQLMLVFILPFMITMWLVKPIVEHPQGPLALGLSLFPLTALPTFIFRITFIPIPLWQLVMAVGILILSACGSIWIAGRTFRIGMLRYGKRLNLAEIFARGHHE